MSRLPLWGRLKANAVACERLINSPSTWNDLPVIPAMIARAKFAVIFSISPHAHAEIDAGGGNSSDCEIFDSSPISAMFATSAAQGADRARSSPGILEFQPKF